MTENNQETAKTQFPSIMLKADVADKLSTSATSVRALVIDELFQAEIEKRKKVVLSILGTIDEKSKELFKLQKQGAVNYNLNGDPIGEPVFTKPQLEEIKKVKEGIEKMQSALDKAFTNNDFQKLFELTK